jgi:hypothetical protein
MDVAPLGPGHITPLGNPSLRPGSRAALRIARQARTARADARADARAAGCSSLGELARALTARGIETPAGGRGWNASQVRRVLKRVDKSYALAPTRPRIEAALSIEPSAAE